MCWPPAPRACASVTRYACVPPLLLAQLQVLPVYITVDGCPVEDPHAAFAHIKILDAEVVITPGK